MKGLVEYLSIKYGIDLSKSSIGHKECSNTGCIINDFPTPNITGHKEVGFTSCPGNNLFSLMEDIRSTDTESLGRSLVMNPVYKSIQIASLGTTIPTDK